MANFVEVIVVDNDSSDGSSELLQNEFPEVILLQNDRNLGFSKANNKGVAFAKGDYVLILNPDTMLSESTLSELLSFCEGKPDFGAAGVQFIDGSGKFLPESKRNFPNLKIAGAKLLGYSKYYYANHIRKDQLAQIDILTGAFMFIKKEVYLKVGGFDEDFFMYGEDIDLSYRITQAGFENHYVGHLKVLHFKGESTVKDKFYLKNFYGALSIFYKKHFPNNSPLSVFINMLIKVIIFTKSVSILPPRKLQETLNTWFYIGDDLDFFKELQIKFPALKFGHCRKVTDELADSDMVFFDGGFLSYKEILDHMENPLLKNVKKRIIDNKHAFCLGSDTPDSRGVVITF